MESKDLLETEWESLSQKMEQLYRVSWQSKDLRLAYLEAASLPREVLVKKLKEALLIALRVIDHAHSYAEASRRIDALLQVRFQLAAYKAAGAKGGNKAAAATHEVRKYAEHLAKDRAPEGGWRSAPHARAEIASDVRAFARQRGRSYSDRKIEEWLRAAGIKR